MSIELVMQVIQQLLNQDGNTLISDALPRIDAARALAKVIENQVHQVG